MEVRKERRDRHNASFSRNFALLGIVEVMNCCIHCRFSDNSFANIGGGEIKKTNNFRIFFVKKFGNGNKHYILNHKKIIGLQKNRGTDAQHSRPPARYYEKKVLLTLSRNSRR